MGVVEKPWGSYEILKTEDKVQVKKIVVKPGCRPSLQSHEHRQEDWIITDGIGIATLGDEDFHVEYGSHIHVDYKEKHRIKNCGIHDLVFIEVQTGTSFQEDDIVRYEDDYDRN